MDSTPTGDRTSFCLLILLDPLNPVKLKQTTKLVELIVIPDFKDKTRYAPYVSLRNQISHIATNKG